MPGDVVCLGCAQHEHTVQLEKLIVCSEYFERDVQRICGENEIREIVEFFVYLSSCCLQGNLKNAENILWIGLKLTQYVLMIEGARIYKWDDSTNNMPTKITLSGIGRPPLSRARNVSTEPRNWQVQP